MSITREQVLETLGRVADPQLEGSLVSAGRIAHVAACDGYVNVRVAAHSPDDPMNATIGALVKKAVESMGEGVRQVRIEFVGGGPAPGRGAGAGGSTGGVEQVPAGGRSGEGSAEGSAKPASGGGGASGGDASNPLPTVKHIVAVGAGKGGVGKSTVAVNLAVGLARRGLRVGLLDGDIYGPSTPTLLGLHDQRPDGTESLLFPFETHGIKAMTMGKLVEAEKPLIWRGPMAHGAFRQLAVQTDWGELDYLIVDLPPGTGDVPLTLAQMLPLAGAILVCTPQRVAQDDAVRAAGMFTQLNVDVLGVVENMSYFIGDDGKEYDIFGRGGAAAMAERLGIALLGTIPIHMDLRANSDAGDPTANYESNEQLAAELNAFVDAVIERVDQRAAAAQGPTLTIS